MAGRDFSVIHTADKKMQAVLETAENIAGSRATVLIHGESGTGKELLARFIHAKSQRASKRLVAINCAAVPEGLLESELFGFEKGAFTGADHSKPGKFELANDSTFLLDEISEMPLLLQAKLLRVIQESEIERVGGKKPIRVNVRLIATTNRSLQEMVEAGQFREDLYYRLNVIPMEIPPLRQRFKDIELLSQLFVEMAAAENGVPVKALSKSAMQTLSTWDWPGNVRELQNVMERSLLLSKGPTIEASDVAITEKRRSKNEKSLKPGMTVSEVEKMLILKTLDFTEQNRTKAAQLLGISIRTLRNKINEYKQVGV